MILLYHKVDLTSKSAFWVSVDTFYRQMHSLLAYDVVSLDDYDPANPRHAVITFDGVYENALEYAVPILREFGYPFELFVIGEHMGKGNEFDAVEPFARFADLDGIEAAVRSGGRVQWHTWSHCRLAGLPRERMEAEVLPPEALRSRLGGDHFGWFAFPHGEYDPALQEIVRERYRGALSCVTGSDDDRYAYNRITVKEDTQWARPRTSVIIANYNYGQYLAEAIESVLCQTVPADEILVIDDASTDDSLMILENYRDRVRIEANETNLGIVENFRKAVSLASGDYIAFLGADNRFRSDYIERCRAALDSDENAAIAYTDVLIFGPRARMMADRDNVTVIGESAAERWPLLWRKYPDPTPEALARFKDHNFVHGSSMYRKRDYLACGGYRESSGPEDHHLFYRMYSLGRSLVHVPLPVLEYRQHSAAQANTVLGLEIRNRALRERVKKLELRNAELEKSAGAAPLEADARAGRERNSRPERDRVRRPELTLEDFDVTVVHYTQVRPAVAMLNSLFRHYPDLSITLVDNSGGVCPAAEELLPHLRAWEDRIEIRVNPATEHGPYGPLSHGGGLDFAVANSPKKYLISLETDSFVLRRGGLEFLVDLMREGYDWAGLGQKPYEGRFGSFSPAIAVFRLDPIREHGLSFRRSDRLPEQIYEDDLVLKHHLDVLRRLREGEPIAFPELKPPDTYRLPVPQILNIEAKHLSYFDTGEALHCELRAKGYHYKLFPPIKAIRHSWGSRSEEIFLANFAVTVPGVDVNEFLPDALKIRREPQA